MATTELGTLKRVDVRNAWSHEAYDFTPWLAENLERLSVELGLELELEGQEVDVGSYRADIVARVPQTDDRVLIENQLEFADLQHLGQVLAYLAGLEAKIVVWIAKGFRDEHISAIRWLNEHTVDPFAFFAVQVGVVQIGNSELAPVFEVLERPNKWDRQVQEAGQSGELTEIGKLKRDFWAHLAERRPEAPKLRSGYAGANFWHSVEKTDFLAVQFVAYGQVGIYVSGLRDEARQNFLVRLHKFRSHFEDAFEGEDFSEEKNASCLLVLKIGSYDQRNWDEMADWLDEHRQKYVEILSGDSCATDQEQIDKTESP